MVFEEVRQLSGLLRKLPTEEIAEGGTESDIHGRLRLHCPPNNHRMWYTPAQDFMRSRGIDAWLVHDFRCSNPILAQLLPGKRFLTRRVTLVVPVAGEPTLIASHIDASSFKNDAAPLAKYLTWGEYHDLLAKAVKGKTRVAMEYSPRCDLPVVGIVDAGMVEFIRSLGPEVVTSADLIQVTIARWSAAAVENHAKASRECARIMADAFAFIKDSLAAGRETNEHEVQRRIRQNFDTAGLEWPDGPIVGVNGHAGDPHFEPSATNPSPVRKGDWVLIDLWARVPGEENIYSDITWVGCCGTPTERQVKVYTAVKGARDAAVRLSQDRWAAKKPVQGWEVDEAAMAVLRGSRAGCAPRRSGSCCRTPRRSDTAAACRRNRGLRRPPRTRATTLGARGSAAA